MPRRGHAAVRIGDYLYVLGGNYGKPGALDLNAPKRIARARIFSDDSIGNFESLATTLKTGRANFTCHVIGNYLYVFGGGTTQCERAAIQPDGSLGAFATEGVPVLKQARTHHASQVVGNSFYVLGGWIPGSFLSSVEKATLQPDGSLGSFEVVGETALPEVRRAGVSLRLGNTLLFVGGTPDGTQLSGKVFSAVIQ
ncbi:Kelch motif protein [compost metagenome]